MSNEEPWSINWVRRQVCDYRMEHTDPPRCLWVRRSDVPNLESLFISIGKAMPYLPDPGPQRTLLGFPVHESEAPELEPDYDASSDLVLGEDPVLSPEVAGAMLAAIEQEHAQRPVLRIYSGTPPGGLDPDLSHTTLIAEIPIVSAEFTFCGAADRHLELGQERPVLRMMHDLNAEAVMVVTPTLEEALAFSEEHLAPDPGLQSLSVDEWARRHGARNEAVVEQVFRINASQPLTAARRAAICAVIEQMLRERGLAALLEHGAVLNLSPGETIAIRALELAEPNDDEALNEGDGIEPAERMAAPDWAEPLERRR